MQRVTKFAVVDRRGVGVAVVVLLIVGICSRAPRPVWAAEAPVPKPANCEAKTEAEMKKYEEIMSGVDVKFEMTPIPGGKFLMGSPANEPKRGDDEGPQHEVTIQPFWMETHETTWDEYQIFMFNLDIQRRETLKQDSTKLDKIADTVSRPTKPYTDMSFGMGKERCPAICMPNYAAPTYRQWLSAKTGPY